MRMNISGSLHEKIKFDFQSDYYFENDVVIVLPLELKHIDELIVIAEDAEVWTYFLDQGIGKEDLTNYCKLAIQSRIQGKEYPFVIFDKRFNEYAGMTRLYDYNFSLDVIKMGHTWIGKKFWGTELNLNVKYLIFQFIFEKLNLERVGFGIHGQNLRSVAAIKKMGCKQEGVLKNFLPSLFGEGRVDLLLFSLLKYNWKNEVKEELIRKLNS